MGITNRRAHESQSSHRLYLCDGCETLAPWGADWEWYGSYAILESYPDDILTFCCSECKNTEKGRSAIRRAKLIKYKRRGYSVSRVGPDSFAETEA